MHRSAVGTFVCLAVVAAVAPVGAEDRWPSFRGPGARGVAEGQDLPVTWDVASGADVRFKVALPGVSHASRSSGTIA